MPDSSTTTEVLLLRRDHLRSQLNAIGDLRPGSLAERYRKCGKSSCHCARKGSRGHGPSYSVTHPVKGKTVTRIIPTGPAVERTRHQIAEYQRFRALVREFVAVSEQLCDLQLRPTESEAPEEVKKTPLAESLAADIVHEVESLLGRQAAQDLDLEALEMAVRQRVLSLAGSFLQRWMNRDTSDYAGPHLPCICRAEARYAGRRQKRFRSALGDLQLQRAYYHCPRCGRGFCPRDRQLGLENTSVSPAVTRMIASVAALVSFQESGELLNELAGVPVDAKQVERTAEALGTEIGEDERRNLEPSDHLDLPPTLYLGMDGTGIPVRSQELAGRAGKQPDGSAKTREVKLCTVWSAEARDPNGTPVRDEGSVTYSAAVESAATSDPTRRAEFTERVLRETTRRRFCQAERRAVLGDGAPWIWNIAHELFPGSIEIVDRFHAKQHLSDLGKAVYGPTDSRAAQWAKRRHAELDDGRFGALLHAISRQIPVCEEARQCLHYFKTNRRRMRYPEFHEQGLCTSTGVVEAGCKVAIGTRLKRAGMHWTLHGSNAIIALRCCRLSGRFQDFWERRSEAKAA